MPVRRHRNPKSLKERILRAGEFATFCLSSPLHRRASQARFVVLGTSVCSLRYVIICCQSSVLLSPLLSRLALTPFDSSLKLEHRRRLQMVCPNNSFYL